MAVEGVTLYLSIAWLCCVGVTVVGNLWCLVAVLRHWASLRPADILVLTITLANLTTALFPVLMYAVVTIRGQTWQEPLCKVFVWSLLSFKMIVSLSVMMYTVTRLCDRSRSRPHSYGVSGEYAKAVSLATCLLPMIVCVLPVAGIAPIMSQSNEFYTNGQCAFSLAATGLEYAVFYMCALFVLLCVGIAAVELIFIRTRKAKKDSTQTTREPESTPETPESNPADPTARERVLDPDRTARQWDFAAVGVTIVCYLLGDIPFLVTNLLDVILGRTPTWLPPTLVSTCLVQTAVAPWVFLTVCDRYRPRCCLCCREGTAKEQQPEELSTAARSRENKKQKASDHPDIPRPHSRVTWNQDGDASDDSTTSEEDVSARGRSTLPTVDEENERPTDPATTLARILLSAKKSEQSPEEDLEVDVKPHVSRRHERKGKAISRDTNKSQSGDIWISGLTEDIVNGKLNDSSHPIATPLHARQARDISKRGEPDGLPPSQLFDGNSAHTSAVSRAVQPPVPQKRKHSRPPPRYSEPPRLETATEGRGFRPYKKDQPWLKNRHSGPPPPYSVALSKLNQNREPHNHIVPRSNIDSKKTNSSSLEIIGQSGHMSDSDTDSSKDPVVPKVRFTHPLALENRAFVASPEEITQLYSPDEEEVEDVSEPVTPIGSPTSPHRGFIALKSLDTRLASQYSVTDQGEMVWHTADKKPVAHLETRPGSEPTASPGDVRRQVPVIHTPSPGRQVVMLSSLEPSWV